MLLALATQEDSLLRELSALTDLLVVDPACLQVDWEFPDGAAHALVRGRVVPAEGLSGVLVRTLPPPPSISYAESDVEYLEIERTAALLGWLRALRCPVLNRAVPLADYTQPALYRYAALFREAGLGLPHVEVSLSGIRTASPLAEPRRVFVAAAEACDEQATDLPPSLGRRCCRLAQGLGLPFLELSVSSEVVLEINAFPDMAGACPALSRRLAGALARLMAAQPVGIPV